MTRSAPLARFLFVAICVGPLGRTAVIAAEPETAAAQLTTRTLWFEFIKHPDDAGKIKNPFYIKVLNERLHGWANARAVGDDRIAIDINGYADDERMQSIRQILGVAGDLEFRIAADLNIAADKPIIKLARELPPDKNDVYLEKWKVAEWIAYSVPEFGEPEAADRYRRGIVKRRAARVPQALVLIDNWNVKGEYITFAHKMVDERDRPVVAIRLNQQGARRMSKLTGLNLPNQATGTRRFLGIILDKKLLSAPSIETPVSDGVEISGEHMSEKEADEIVDMIQERRRRSTLREISGEASAK